jgi:Na+/proline symporter
LIELGFDLVFWCSLYIVLLLVIGALGRQAREADTLSDRILGGRTLGFLVLVTTLFATQYSGNTLSGFPGQIYREGLAYFMTLTFMVGIVAGYTLFAPRLFALSRERKYVTPTDFLHDRYRSPVLNYLSAAIFAIALGNFLLAQLIALGSAFSSLTVGQIPYWAAVVGGGLVVLVYVLMGGMRAVAWTDVVQAALILIGLLLILVMIWVEVGSPASVARTVRLLRPEMMANPSWETCFIWLSNFLLLALGAPLYPQAIQRIYASRRLSYLRRALVAMAFIPLLVVAIVIFIGATGIALFPELDRVASEQVTLRVVAYLLESNTIAYYPVVMVMMALVAAIMSTADSCLLSLSSIITKDFAARLKGLGADEAERYTRLVPWCSIAIMVVLTILAMRPLTTLWGLLVVKFEILIQLSPAFVLGTLHERGAPRAFAVGDILKGLGAGLLVTLGLYLGGLQDVYGLHAGTVGAAVNYLVVVSARAIRLRTTAAPREDAVTPARRPAPTT